MSSTCRMKGLDRSSGDKEVTCEILGIGVPARALMRQNDRPACALLLCPPVSRPELEQAETAQEKDSEEGKSRCAPAVSAWPQSALAKGSEALTLSSCGLALSRTNLSAPCHSICLKRMQHSQGQRRMHMAEKGCLQGRGPEHVTGCF